MWNTFLFVPGPYANTRSSEFPRKRVPAVSDYRCEGWKTLLKALSYNGAIRSRWPRAKLDLQYHCSLSQQIFLDATNAVYGFIFRHVWQACCLSESLGDVILGDLVESVLGFWWVLEVSEMMATHKDSELMRSFLSNLEIAVTSVYYWRSQDGPWFEKISSSILCRARSYASDSNSLGIA